MIEYTKLFQTLKENGMKKTDLLKVVSSQTLAKLGKNEIVTTETIDKICLFLGTQPSDIMEVYEYQEINGEKIKIKTRNIANLASDISYGVHTEKLTGITLSDLKNVVTETGYIDIKKLDEMILKAEDKMYGHTK